MSTPPSPFASTAWDNRLVTERYRQKLCLACLEPCRRLFRLCLFPQGDTVRHGVRPDGGIRGQRRCAGHAVGALFLPLCSVAGAAWRHARDIRHAYSAVRMPASCRGRVDIVRAGAQRRGRLSRALFDRFRLQRRVSGIAGTGIEMVSAASLCLSGRSVDVRGDDKRDGGAGAAGLPDRHIRVAREHPCTRHGGVRPVASGVPFCPQSTCEPGPGNRTAVGKPREMA